MLRRWNSFPFLCYTLCSPLWCLCSRKLKKDFIDQEGVRMAVSSMLKSPVHFVFFDIDARSRFSDVLLVQFNYLCEVFSYPFCLLISHFPPAYIAILPLFPTIITQSLPLKCPNSPLPSFWVMQHLLFHPKHVSRLSMHLIMNLVCWAGMVLDPNSYKI